MLKGGGGIFKSAAVMVLRQDRRLLTTADITKLALERQHIKCQGRTPEATMASALYTDVKRKGNKSVFTRPQEGLFGLQEWEEQGFVPEAVPGHPQPQPLIVRGMHFEGLRRASTGGQGSAEDAEEETSELMEIQSTPPVQGGAALESPSPLLRVSNPMSEYRTQKDSALQLLGDVCLKPTLSEGSAERAAGAAAPELGVKPEVEAGPQSTFPETGQGGAGRAQPLDPGQEGLAPAGPGRPLSSPLRLDRLAMFHDMVTSPEGRARLAEVYSPGGGAGNARKRPRLELDVDEMDSVDLERVASFARYSPSTSAFLAGFLPSAQSLPGPLFTSSPPLADISPLPFATLHRPESATPHVQSSGGLPTPTMISLAFGEAEAHASAAIGAVMQQAAEQAPHSSSAARAASRLPEAAQGLPACAFAFPPLHAGRAQTAVRHERLPPPLVLPTCEDGASASQQDLQALVQQQQQQQLLLHTEASRTRAQHIGRASADASRKQRRAAQGLPPDAGVGLSTSERLQRIEAKVRQMEHTLGLDNPQVGKAWLYLSKAYQNYGAGKDAEQAKEKSEAALFRSFQCMQACSSLCTTFFDACPSADLTLPAAPTDNVDFAYLLSNMRAPPQQHQQPP
ncbi:hypothetical protein CVIRNUC_001665 [Coccomyxa viridis]|uniref:HTH HARE-type domain-containing protein n=1 Tax=Coccomyxa viridis TaxID=1274662 RepID=A0AAV1HW35_9CHLO|nr:hypothetical protein CVIRNUC_001665 [Coccomyxa viridis]